MSKAPINTKSGSYAKDREAFLKDLRQFNDSKGISNRPPFVNGQEIDLYLFYLLVTQRGGVSKNEKREMLEVVTSYRKKFSLKESLLTILLSLHVQQVNQQGGWDTFLRPLHLPAPCVNGAALLRRIYGATLERYERARGPPGRDDDNDMEDDYRRGGRGSAAPRYVHTAQADWNRWSTRVAGPSERLALSLLSPMPNEQDFAVNVCTVLAADVSNRLPLTTTPHILDFLLAHAGVYNHLSLRDTIGRSYREARGMSPDEFWALRAGGGGARELADETKFMSFCASERAELMVQALAAHNTLSDRLLQEPDDKASLSPDVSEIIEEPPRVEPSDDWMSEARDEEQLFAPRLSGGARCVYTQRVIQVASIVRSLSFHEDSLPLLAKHSTLLRFLLLCANCWVGTLRQTGLDTLGNIAQELVIKDPATCLLSRHVLSTVQAALISADRARVLAALELLNKLAQNEANEEVLLRCLEPEVYEEVCSLLTLRDIMLLVCTLECVYALTSLGERACERAARVTGLVHTLVSLLTVEAQSYGPKACIQMRVVETVSGPVDAAAATTTTPVPTPHHSQPSTPVKSRQAQQTQPAPEPPPAAPAPPAVSAPTTPATPAPAPTTVQALHAQQQQVQENEQFALAWLRAAWEPSPVVVNNSGSDAAEVYRQYVVCCQKVGRKGLIAPSHFPRLVRSVFGGTVGPNNVAIGSGETQQVYVGIRARNMGSRNAAQFGGPASPILKAQLTNVKEQTPGKPTVSQAQGTPSTPHPHLSQALEPSATSTVTTVASGAAGQGSTSATASNTSLIKHLLAHKVSATTHPHSHAQQVAQRQNQQRLLGQPTATGNTQQASTTSLGVDPEELIKCSTITSTGVSSTLPSHDQNAKNAGQISDENQGDRKQEQAVEIQIDESSQLTMKSSQNKMLADLLEKKSTPPVQVVQVTPQINAPTIQITETGQIVQVKNESPVIHVKEGVPQHFVQIKNDQGQIIHLKNDQGQIIHIKNEQGQIFQIKNEGGMLNQPGQIIQIKNEQGQIIHAGQIVQQNQGQQGQMGGQSVQQSGQIVQQGQLVGQGQMVQQGSQLIQQGQISIQGGQIIQPGQIVQSQIVQQGGQLIQQGGQMIHQGGQIIQQGGQIIQQGGQIVQGGQIIQQAGQIVQSGGHIVQGQIIQSSGGQIIQGGQIVQVQGGQIVQGQMMQQVMKTEGPIETIDLDPDSQEPPSKKMKTEEQGVMSQSQESVSKTAANLYAALAASALEDEEDMPLQVQQPTMQVQQPSSQPQPPVQVTQPTMQVQQPVLQVQPMEVQMQNMISSPPPQLILQEKPIVSQTPQFVQQPMQIIATPSSGPGGLSYITQNLPGNMMQSHKTIIIVQGGGGGGPITLTVNNPGGLDEATLNSLISQASEAITQQQMIQNTGVIQPTQRVIHSQPALINSQGMGAAKQSVAQGTPKLVVQKPQSGIITQPSQLMTGNPNIVSGNQQLGNQIVTVSAAQQLGNQIVTVSGAQQLGNQIVTVSGGQQLMSSPQFVSVSGAQQIIMNASIKSGVHRVLQPPQRAQVSGVVQSATADTKPTVIQSNVVQTQKVGDKPTATATTLRQVIRQPVMRGNTKIGEELLIRHTSTTEPPPLVQKEKPATAKSVQPATPAQSTSASSTPAAKTEDTPWICHWKGCSKTFESAAAVFGHAARTHCPPAASGEAPCLWLDCDRVPRKTFALLNHLHDRHCTADALRTVFASRRHITAEAEAGKSVSLGYPPNAALAALNKHAVDFLNPRELMDDNEGPVTKSIRLTAALILRNLVIYSNNGRRQLRIYEHHLSTIALSSVEASRTIAQVLYDMNNI